ncbi:dihydroorotase [Oceanobacter mangrovi]|uniref:dihydroorotase n=1 Tax=Oceanobacter mangrovi TaxID=2862510 RepID=UPI001C8D6759|nr:dihydroorotase [Oceanobacter mangrovi]
MKYLHIRDARVISPDQQLDQICDIYVGEGRIRAIGQKPAGGTIESTLDAQGLWLLPGFIDLSSYLNEPGYPHRGTIASETLIAASAGFTHVCAQPLTRPVADSAAVVQLMLDKAASAGYTRVLPLGALTQGLEGEQLSNMVGLRNAGCVALSNARQPIKDAYVMRRLMEYAATYDIRLFLHANDAALSAGGVMHEGPTATRMGLAGIPETAETIALAQILLLAEQTGAKVHISQISCARSIEKLRDAWQHGLPVTADVAIANLCFTDACVNGFDSHFHVQPPLRSEADRQALLQAVNAGELAICSNHQQHEIAAKKAPFADSAAGMAVYGSFTGLLMGLINRGELELNATLRALSSLPAAVLQLQTGLQEGELFNASLIDPMAKTGQGLGGKVVATFVDGYRSFRTDVDSKAAL